MYVRRFYSPYPVTQIVDPVKPGVVGPVKPGAPSSEPDAANPDKSGEVVEAGSRISIKYDELHHLRTVNRAVVGDGIQVIDGKGWLFRGKIHTINQREAVVEIEAQEFQERPAATVIVVPSLTKRRAMSVMVEKLVEMGVDEIRPVVCARTDERYSSSMLDKWKRLAIQALKVNGKLWATQIYPPAGLREVITGLDGIGTRILLHVEGKKMEPGQMQTPVLSVVGPPGDFIEEERAWLVENDFIQYKINDCILKTETAAISIAAHLKACAL
ncbi:MAG: 16S rRNA (uracil(1498)-N(3))-methyltransferase [bacterium]|nr:16S rRNA (uracil(1498)-N(3))-methyltransferase [bacterium]